jgi:nucleotide-binding universal stress UspA family protein
MPRVGARTPVGVGSGRCVDLSPASAEAMACGLRVLAGIGAGPGAHPRSAIEALFVVETGLPGALGLGADPHQVERQAEEGLKAFLDGLRLDPGWHLAGRVRGGAAADAEILARCRDAAPDLVVLGTHGRSGFQRFLIGSVTESVMRHAQRSVLVIPPRVARGAAYHAASLGQTAAVAAGLAARA